MRRRTWSRQGARSATFVAPIVNRTTSKRRYITIPAIVAFAKGILMLEFVRFALIKIKPASRFAVLLVATMLSLAAGHAQSAGADANAAARELITTMKLDQQFK